MKRLLILTISLLWLIPCSFGQDANSSQNEAVKTIYQISGGLNAIDNTSGSSPFSNPGDWYVSTPISIGIEARSYYNSNMALVGYFGFNKYDGLNYFSLDAGFKYYLNDWIPIEKIEIAPEIGGGVFNIDKTNVSVNLGGSVAYWINKKLALRLRSIAKFAINNGSDYNISNGHYLHNLELVFVL